MWSRRGWVFHVDEGAFGQLRWSRPDEALRVGAKLGRVVCHLHAGAATVFLQSKNTPFDPAHGLVVFARRMYRRIRTTQATVLTVPAVAAI